jgi:hypothetical protein
VGSIPTYLNVDTIVYTVLSPWYKSFPNLAKRIFIPGEPDLESMPVLATYCEIARRQRTSKSTLLLILAE